MEAGVIELKQLTKKYGEFTAVDRLDLTIRQGEIFGLLGPNGAGKTTTILMMLGLTEPTSGSATVCGLDATRQPMLVKRRVGYMPDDIGFYDDRSGLDNLVYTARLNGVPEKDARERAMLLLEKVGLADAARKKTGAYSRGMRQRLGLADVLIKRPDVIILDEPTLGIDPEGVRELLVLIREMSRTEGLTVLLSSHHLHQVQQICDRVGLFVKGRLIAAGDLDTLSRELDGGPTHLVEIDVGGWDSALEETLLSLEGVLAVNRCETDALSGSGAGDASSDLATIRVASGVDVTASLASAVVSSGASLLGLRPTRYGLDDIYHRYFEGGDSHERTS
ncbi:ABC transporter ATP-binding protein [Cohnella thailandensis]|uniref:ABC transporter ATP-binding protein n=1 Tax=Cohnella thailandensis TaxID=557557 RepID=A0A841SX36_9BACL|nr:ABC transporter ATP-binding protein [Cohnella thailandensis]MBB6635489.1 ABC transporter ATP-binding protein [Cohnella thailandensis]MBP1974869.1 ABC-2 type transport system ATP-binding protein [Cohnella thailandensis]